MLEDRVKKLHKLQSKVDVLERDAYTLRQEKDEASDQLSILQNALREKNKDVARLEREVSRTSSIQSASPEEVAALRLTLKQTQEALEKALAELKEKSERLKTQGTLLERYESQIALSEEAPKDLSQDRVNDLTNALTSRLQKDFMRQQTETKIQYEASIKQSTRILRIVTRRSQGKRQKPRRLLNRTSQKREISPTTSRTSSRKRKRR